MQATYGPPVDRDGEKIEVNEEVNFNNEFGWIITVLFFMVLVLQGFTYVLFCYYVNLKRHVEKMVLPVQMRVLSHFKNSEDLQRAGQSNEAQAKALKEMITHHAIRGI